MSACWSSRATRSTTARSSAVARERIGSGSSSRTVKHSIRAKALAEGDRVFDLVVRYVPEARSTLGEIGNILVPAPNGARIPLSRLAEIGTGDGASVIARRENRRQISVPSGGAIKAGSSPMRRPGWPGKSTFRPATAWNGAVSSRTLTARADGFSGSFR
jgi:hypothetical protein